MLQQTPTPWATPTDVRNAWLLDAELTLSDETMKVWIQRAQDDLVSRKTSLVSEVAASSELARQARDVVVSMVTRVFANPEGLRSSMGATGPFTEQVMFAGENPGELMPTRAELARLGILERPTRRQRAFSVRTAPPRVGW